jgi:regulatory protein
MSERRQKKAPDGKPVRPTPEQIRRRTFHRAVTLLAARPLSVAELSELLLKGRNTIKSVVEEALTRLSEYGYLDDRRFAVGFASFKVRQKPVGRQRLKRDLALKKVDRAVADEALELVFSEFSEEDLINKAIEKHNRLRGRPVSRNDAKKLFDYLLRRGFPFDLVAEKLRSITPGDFEQLE